MVDNENQRPTILEWLVMEIYLKYEYVCNASCEKSTQHFDTFDHDLSELICLFEPLYLRNEYFDWVFVFNY